MCAFLDPWLWVRSSGLPCSFGYKDQHFLFLIWLPLGGVAFNSVVGTDFSSRFYPPIHCQLASSNKPDI